MARRFTVRRRNKGDEFVANIARANPAAIKEVEKLLNREIQKQLNTPGPAPSKPGQSPHRQTGVGRKNVKVRSNKSAGTVTIRVNKAGWYLAYWEDPSTPRRRPWARVTLRRLNKEITRIVDKHIKRAARRGSRA